MMILKKLREILFLAKAVLKRTDRPVPLFVPPLKLEFIHPKPHLASNSSEYPDV